MASAIREQIRALKDLPKWEAGSRGDAIIEQIGEMLKAEELDEAEATQLVYDVRNEISRILRSPGNAVTHECDETGRVLSSRVDYLDGSARTRERDAAGNLTDWVDVPAPSKPDVPDR